MLPLQSKWRSQWPPPQESVSLLSSGTGLDQLGPEQVFSGMTWRWNQCNYDFFPDFSTAKVFHCFCPYLPSNFIPFPPPVLRNCLIRLVSYWDKKLRQAWSDKLLGQSQHRGAAAWWSGPAGIRLKFPGDVPSSLAPRCASASVRLWGWLAADCGSDPLLP